MCPGSSRRNLQFHNANVSETEWDICIMYCWRRRWRVALRRESKIMKERERETKNERDREERERKREAREARDVSKLRYNTTLALYYVCFCGRHPYVPVSSTMQHARTLTHTNASSMHGMQLCWNSIKKVSDYSGRVFSLFLFLCFLRGDKFYSLRFNYTVLRVPCSAFAVTGWLLVAACFHHFHCRQ